MVLILALDPGITTGYAVGEVSEERFRFLYAGEEKLIPIRLFSMLESISPAYLVTESFEFRQNTRDNVELFSRDLLGVCSMWAALRHSDHRYQSASEGKGFYTDEKLRRLDCYSRGKVHARDATRHLLYFMAHKAGSKLHTKESRLAIFGIDDQ